MTSVGWVRVRPEDGPGLVSVRVTSEPEVLPPRWSFGCRRRRPGRVVGSIVCPVDAKPAEYDDRGLALPYPWAVGDRVTVRELRELSTPCGRCWRCLVRRAVLGRFYRWYASTETLPAHLRAQARVDLAELMRERRR